MSTDRLTPLPVPHEHSLNESADKNRFVACLQRSENKLFYMNLSEKQVHIKWKQVAADYLVAERETLEQEKGGRKKGCENSGKKKQDK